MFQNVQRRLLAFSESDVSYLKKKLKIHIENINYCLIVYYSSSFFFRYGMNMK